MLFLCELYMQSVQLSLQLGCLSGGLIFVSPRPEIKHLLDFAVDKQKGISFGTKTKELR